MSDYLDDELKIMEEQAEDSTAIKADCFREPIRNMKISRVYCVDEGTLTGEVIKKMQDENYGSVLLTKNKKLSGIFTERDVLRRIVGKDDNFKNKPIQHI